MFGGALSVPAMFGADRGEPQTAAERVELRAITVTAFLMRYAARLAAAYPGTTLVTLRELSLRDIAHLLYWRAQAAARDDDREDVHDEMFGEAR